MARNVENKCSIPDDHIGPRRSALFVATSLLGGYLDGRHQCLFDVIGERQRHQKYQRPFRRVMKLRGSWQNTTEHHRTPQNATERLSRLSGNGANATVFRIIATQPPLSSDHPHTSARGHGGCSAQHLTGVAR